MSTNSIRRAQTISPFGVGAIVNQDGQSFVIVDTSKWGSKRGNKRIYAPDLEERFVNKRFYTFSDEQRFGKEELTAKRFPRWYHCPKCNILVHLWNDKDSYEIRENAICCNKKECKTMNPMRYVAYCDNGHLSDINWSVVCHAGSTQGACVNGEMSYIITGKSGGGFNGMFLECRSCGAKNSLSALEYPTLPDVFLYSEKGKSCTGNNPWDGKERVDCDKKMLVEPTGASALHRPKIISALDLSTHNKGQDEKKKEIDDYFDRQVKRRNCKSITDFKTWRITIDDEETRLANFAEDYGIEKEFLKQEILIRILARIDEKTTIPMQEVDQIQEEIDISEMEVFKKGMNVDSTNLKIQYCENNEDKYPFLFRLFSKIAQVKTLREIRVLYAFTRGQGHQSIGVGPNEDWYPAVDSLGEGIYFQINSNSYIDYYKKNADGLDQVTKPQIKRLNEMQENFPLNIPDSPIFILAHTLSHLLMRELTFRSGYSSSALRERIFIDQNDGYAGILIYTTDSDMDGTLGGLVDQARLDVLNQVINGVTEGAQWCSGDPICRETERQGLNGLNYSSCHCCSLVSETSCVYHNAMLNRIMLGGLGDTNNELIGFLKYLEI